MLRGECDLTLDLPDLLSDHERAMPSVVPIFLERLSELAEARLRELGKPFEEYRYDAGHGSLVIDEQIRQIEREIAFAAKHLGTNPPLA